jgi:putative holliday junction resolvase
MEFFVLGLDIGKKRIGVAGCDRLGLGPTELTTIERTTLAQVIAALRVIVEERQIDRLVVGMPYRMDGSIGTQAKNTRRTAKAIAKALALPIEFVDERLTSDAAEERLRAENIMPSWNKGLVDRKAAAIILQQWLMAQPESRSVR